MAFWNRCFEYIVERQRKWETIALAIIDADDPVDMKVQKLCALADDAVKDWWILDDEIMLRFGDGWEHEWDKKNGSSKCKPLE